MSQYSSIWSALIWRTFIAGLLLLSAAAGYQPFVRICSAEIPDRIKIGVSLPLSGESANEGYDLRALIEFANQQIGHDHYQLLFEDDGCSDRQAVTIAQRFVSVEKVKYVIGFACSGNVLAAAPVYERGQVLVIALATGAPAISAAGDYIFRTIPNLEVAALRLFEHAQSHYKKIAVISEETAYALGLADALIRRSEHSRLQIVSESFLSGTTDFSSLLLKLRAAKVEAVFLNPQNEAAFINMYRQLLDSKWRPAVYGTYIPSWPLFLKTFGKDADGIVYADLPFVASALDSESKRLYNQFSAMHGAPRSSEFYFVTAVGAFIALDQAIRSNTEVKTYLYQNKFSGWFGTYWFDSYGDIQGDKLTFVLKTIRDGAPQLLK